MSEKARENLRQEKESKGKGEGMDMDRGQEAIAAVEHAMEHLHEHDRAERSSRAAAAAMARLQQQQYEEQQGTTEWALITPDEPDRDELRECIQEAPPGDLTLIPSIITKLLETCHVHNWRELANISDTTVLTNALDDVTADQVTKWIDRAQGESVDEIMVEICDGNIDHVQALTEKARTGTPKDLAAWRLIPETLQESLTGDSVKPTNAQLATWTKRAHTLLQKYEWLNWYATPVE